MRLASPLLLSMGLFFAREIFAQGVSFPSDQAIQEEMKRQQSEQKRLFEDVGTALNVPAPRAPVIETPKPAGVDISRMAAEYRTKVLAVPKPGYELAVFVSFSMPEASLVRVAEDIQRAGGILVMRGFKNGSLRETQAAIMALGDIPVQINPKAFTQYKVDLVPTVVLARTDAGNQLDGEGCALPSAYVSLTGDVGLEYALDYIGSHDASFANYARQLGARLRRAP